MSTDSFQHALYPMDTGFYNSLGNYTLESRCGIAAELGFADTYLTLWSPDAWEELKQLKSIPAKHGLGVAAVYQAVNLDELTDPRPTLGKVEEILNCLPEGSILELAVKQSKEGTFKESDEAGDALLIPFLEKALTLAEKTGHTISLYHHIQFWMLQVADSIRICQKVNHPKLGLNFNAFHWYATDGKNLDTTLRAAAPYLKLVTLNGARRSGDIPDERPTLEPLESGELDLFSVLGALHREAQFSGKIGFQGYSWGGDIYAKLQRSITYFREMEARLNKHPDWAILNREPHRPLRRR